MDSNNDKFQQNAYILLTGKCTCFLHFCKFQKYEAAKLSVT